MDDKILLDEIELNSKAQFKKKRSRSILDELDDITSDEGTSSPSSIMMSSLTKKDKKKDIDSSGDTENDSNEDELDDEWINAISSFKTPKTKKQKKNLFKGFEPEKKKKKKEKTGGAVSHKKDFDPELALLRELQMDQAKFVDSLQKRYDQMEGTKSTARGVGKYTTDLCNTITQARSVSMQLVDKIISTKKTIADLDFKERKEFGSGGNSEQTNMANYASTYLKQVMTAGRNNVINSMEGNYGSQTSFEYDDSNDDDLFSSIDENLGATGRSDDVEKYLKYENENVSVKVLWYDDKDDDDPNKYEFVAYTQNGIELSPSEYPLPLKTKMNINRSTGTATDIYGNKYELVVL